MFDGNTLKYTLITEEVGQKASTSSEASSDSGRCKKSDDTEVPEDQFTVYPNPVTTTVNIQVNDDAISSQIDNGYQVVVVDAYGMPVASSAIWNTASSIIEIDLSSLPQGVYLIRLLYGTTSSSFTILKE